ncbi:hypothetical protein [Chryseobacterium sp. GP-SGM7]|uniref:hypothetical protein n=1 Tax=Chryseobacterium sp. GP-SGM7 TaxID=3411323 RepID=UPI003B9545C9
MYLLKTGYEHDRYDFKISDIEIGRALGLTAKTVKSTKEKLHTKGLIEFQSANGVPCYYRLLLNYRLDFISDKIQEQNTTTVEQFLKPTGEEISFKPANINEGNINIPSLYDVIEFVKTLENYESNLDSNITEKYSIWVKNGWKNSSNRPIGNWKATLKSALPYMKNSQEKSSTSIESIPNIKRPEL